MRKPCVATQATHEQTLAHSFAIWRTGIDEILAYFGTGVEERLQRGYVAQWAAPQGAAPDDGLIRC
jgi:hypothetical protein